MDEFFFTRQIPKMCDPILATVLKMQSHYSQSSRENATPSSGTSSLAFNKEVPPGAGSCNVVGLRIVMTGDRALAIHVPEIDRDCHYLEGLSPSLFTQFCEEPAIPFRLSRRNTLVALCYSSSHQEEKVLIKYQFLRSTIIQLIVER